MPGVEGTGSHERLPPTGHFCLQNGKMERLPFSAHCRCPWFVPRRPTLRLRRVTEWNSPIFGKGFAGLPLSHGHQLIG